MRGDATKLKIGLSSSQERAIIIICTKCTSFYILWEIQIKNHDLITNIIIIVIIPPVILSLSFT